MAGSRLSKPPPEVTSKAEPARPQLPPRRSMASANSALLDAKDDEGMDGLKDWEVLKPD
jgi:hypothetical protein